MATYLFHMRYQLEDDPVARVVADQRDVAAYEAEPFGHPVTGDAADLPVTFWRYLAWRASHRDAQHTLSWKRWGQVCIWADVQPGGVPEDGEDPGRPGQSDTPS